MVGGWQDSIRGMIGMRAKGKQSKKHKKEAGGYGAETLPMQLDRLGSAAEHFASAAHHMSDGVNDLLNGRAYRRELKANGEALRNEIPTVRVLSDSLATYFRNKSYLEMLGTFLNGVQTVFKVLDIIYGKSELEEIGIKIAGGLEAQVGLDAPKKFGKHVYDFVSHTMRSSTSRGERHLYFLYHPGNNWHPKFEKLARKKPLGSSFLGTSDSLDAIVTYMRFFRWFLEGNKKQKPAVFHLLMPAYRTTVIKDPLEFPDLGTLVIHGEKPDTNPYTWLNLPTIHQYPSAITFGSVGNLAQNGTKRRTGAQCIYDAAASLAEWCGLAEGEKPLRRLGIEAPVVGGEAEPECGEESDRESISSTTAQYGS